MAKKSIQINKITNANVYLDGESCLGRVEEMTPPTIKNKLAEHNALGMIGSLEYVTGIDKMETSVKWSAFYKDVWKKIANPFKAIKLQVRFSVDEYEGAERIAQTPAILYLTVQSKETPLGAFKPQQNAENTSNFTCMYCKLEIDGEEIVEVDIEANIWRVDGVDLLEQYRSNLGI